MDIDLQVSLAREHHNALLHEVEQLFALEHLEAVNVVEECLCVLSHRIGGSKYVSERLAQLEIREDVLKVVVNQVERLGSKYCGIENPMQVASMRMTYQIKLDLIYLLLQKGVPGLLDQLENEGLAKGMPDAIALLIGYCTLSSDSRFEQLRDNVEQKRIHDADEIVGRFIRNLQPHASWLSDYYWFPILKTEIIRFALMFIRERMQLRTTDDYYSV